MKKDKEHPADKSIPFEDNKGNRMRLGKDLTIEDLLRMGITIKIEKVGTPLPDGWFADVDPRREDGKEQL